MNIKCFLQLFVLGTVTAVLSVPSVLAKEAGKMSDVKVITKEGNLIIDNQIVQLRIYKVNGFYKQEYAIVDKSGNWKQIISTIDSKKEEMSTFVRKHLSYAAVYNQAEILEESTEQTTVMLKGTHKGHQLCTYITVSGGCKYVHVVVEDRPDKSAAAISSLMSSYAFLPEGKLYSEYRPLDFTWTPALRPEDDQVIGDHVFRSPVLILQQSGLTAAIIPDLDVLKENRPMPTAMDLDIQNGILDAPIFSYGFCAYEPIPHVYYQYKPTAVQSFPQDSTLKYGYRIYLDGKAPEKAVREVVGFLWEKYGREYLKDVRPQVVPFELYGKEYAYPGELEEEWKECKIDGILCGGIDNPARRGANYHSWENDVCMTYGMYWYGKSWKDNELVRKAKAIKNLALMAPQKEGIFPNIYVFAETRWQGCLHWTTSGIDYNTGYDTAACSTTCVWLLKWYKDLEQDSKIIEHCEGYAKFLVNKQERSGAIPAWFKQDLTPSEALRESATTAASVWFLAELHRIVGKEEYLRAARKGAEFIVKEVLPQMKFFDFETFFSCSEKSLDMFDAHTGMYPHNTLAMQWTAEAFGKLYEITKNDKYLNYGIKVVDLLCLYQQVWNPSYKSAYLFGGFGVMNTDGEWNDGRQSRFVPTLVDYYALTGNEEYIERAIAATRASFALVNMPENHDNDISHYEQKGLGFSSENCCHGGGDDFGGWSGFNWGAGGGMTASAYITLRFGGAYINVAKEKGFGIDGCQIQDLRIHKDEISFKLIGQLYSLKSPVKEPYEVVVKMGNLTHDKYRLSINNKPAKTYTRAELSAGIKVSPIKSQ